MRNGITHSTGALSHHALNITTRIAGARYIVPLFASSTAFDTGLIRPLLLVHVDILGVNHVVRFASLWPAAGRSRARSSACCRTGSLAALRLRLLVHFFGYLVQRSLHVFRGRAKPRRS